MRTTISGCSDAEVFQNSDKNTWPRKEASFKVYRAI